jgi:hypothetical protein
MATKEQMDENAADYADQFNAPDAAPRNMSDEEAFGLSEPEAAAEPAAEAPGEAVAEAGAEEPAAEAAAEPAAEASPDAPAEAAPSAAEQEQRLKSWEGRLKARQAELDAREAAMGDSSVNEQQESLPLEEGEAVAVAEEAGEAATSDNADPAAVLAEDFGADFVEQITKLVKQIAHDCVGGVSATVDQVIADLKNERLQSHFTAIADVHKDFMEVVESPEFSAWRASQPNQDALQQVIDSGSARQIIDMLTAFKGASKSEPADDSGYDSHDDALDAAEGVRSSGVSLPQEPAASDDFAKAWNEA